MSSRNVLALGAASWNRMVYVDRLPQGPEATIIPRRQLETAGSTGMGKAMTAAALGHRTTLHCALGQDAYATNIAQTCASRGIRMIADIQPDPTPHHLNLMDPSGGRYSIFLSNGADTPTIDTDRLGAAIRDADMIFLSLCQSSIVALPLLSRAQCPIHLDLHDYNGTNPWCDPFIAWADVVQMSDVALPGDPSGVIAKLLSGRATQVVLTRGAAGAVIHDREGHTCIPSAKATLADSNGAGDAYAVALWHALDQGHTIRAAGEFAARAAALAVESTALYPAGGTPDAVAARPL